MIGLIAASLSAAVPVGALPAQDATNNSSGTVIGPPQLKDFSLTPRERIVTQPPPEATPEPATKAPAEPRTEQPAQPRTQPPPARRTTDPASSASPPVQRETEADQTADTVPAPAPAEPVLPEPDADSAASPPQAEPDGEGSSYWLYAIPALMLALLGAAAAQRRRRRPEALVSPTPEAAAPPRPDPLQRPWLELEMTALRAGMTDEEAQIEFDLLIRNSGKTAARNIRINARMFNAGASQDADIGAFFRTRGEGRKTFSVPAMAAGQEGVLNGSVVMPREELRGIAVDNRVLFVPMVAVNTMYEWEGGRTGQTSKSYVVGREVSGPDGKMGAFRLDLGPRVWRTVGQRQHKLARRI